MWWGIKFIILETVVRFGPWMLLWLGITGIAFISGEKKIARWILKIAGTVTLCVMLKVLVDDLTDIIKYSSMQYGIWMALCLTVTLITVLVHLINKKLRKKKTIHWTIKLAGCAAFYAFSLFVIMKLLGSYPGNWLGTDEEYRELAYELYHLNLDCYKYEYARISEGSYGEIIFSFSSDREISDQSLERTIKQMDYIEIKNAVEEYINMNGSIQGNRIKIEFLDAFHAGAWEYVGNIYNFDPRTGEMGTDDTYWFITDIKVNDCTELAEFYQDFSGISADVQTMDGMQDLASLSNLTYLQLYVDGAVKEDNDLKEQYLEELNTLLPDCEISLKQHMINSPY